MEFRMPLQSHDESRLGVANRLDNVVGT
jgi:hypothetical protein